MNYIYGYRLYIYIHACILINYLFLSIFGLFTLFYIIDILFVEICMYFPKCYQTLNDKPTYSCSYTSLVVLLTLYIYYII